MRAVCKAPSRCVKLATAASPAVVSVTCICVPLRLLRPGQVLMSDELEKVALAMFNCKVSGPQHQGNSGALQSCFMSARAETPAQLSWHQQSGDCTPI